MAKRTRIEKLSDEEIGRFDEWADKWIAIGLRTGPADRPTFERAAQACYGYAKIPWPARGVEWVLSPLALARAAQMVIAEGPESSQWAPMTWQNYIGGQFWVGGTWWGGAWTSFFREVCGLDLPGDLWDRARAYEATMESACWWWPHHQVVIACEHPTVIHREPAAQVIDRGRGVQRLHCETGPAIAWPDGWGVWAIHGVRVPQRVVEAPESLTVSEILKEPNAEVRRVMLARFGEARFMLQSGALPIQSDETGDLYQIALPSDEPLVLVRVLNATSDDDGSRKPYWLRVPPDMTTARAAVAWTFNTPASEYHPDRET